MGADWSYGWSLLRVAAWLRRQPDGNELVDRFYQATGRALHEEGRKVHTPEGAVSVMAGAGLDPGAVDVAIGDSTTHADVRADHERVVSLGGFGVPTLVINGDAVIFGPVVTPAPEGSAAGRLWDFTVGWGEFPHLYEMRRPKTREDMVHITSNFAPYLRARDWGTIQKPVA